MSHFSTQSLSYDSPYLLPHFKNEGQLPNSWHTQVNHPSQNFDDLAREVVGTFDEGGPPTSQPDAPVASSAGGARKKARSKNGVSKSSYKHVPHREKPPHLVARRNARERRRVQAVNTAFSRLRRSVPSENKNKRLSKVKTLHRAIEYIQMLQDMLSKADEELGSDELCLGSVGTDSLNKENELHQRWLQLPTSWTDDNQNSCLSFYDDFGDGI
ncbi:achaete-scute-like protein [Trichonephila clavata]|uniref:Achaete-scute-like protein n=1 Tax=Trichonephila clavata TaxID=2740835 RepID=A0A8X6IBL9_TRICU|nr:achaete-scute-like protein [Trichonephila clavata]